MAEYNGAGTLLRRYAHGAGVGEPLVWYEGSTTTDRRWLLGDERGSIIAETDGAGAASIYAYDAYGIPKNDIWTGSRFRYTGQIVLDAPAKLYHYKARVYDPKIGRFFQTDPIGYEDQFNLYAYVGNDPVNKLDSTGTRIQLAIHEVAFGNYHAKIVIVPDDQVAFRNDSRFQTTPEGIKYLTIGGGPDTDANIFGPLVGGVNRPNDVSKTLTGESYEVARISPGKGDNEINLINRMIDVAESYENDKLYSLFPSTEGDDYNSNGFAYGVLGALGLTDAPIPPGVKLPGADKPVKPEYFCKPGPFGCL